MTFPSKPQFHQRPRTFSSIEIDQFARLSFDRKCEQFHEGTRPFAAFILNISGELQMVSFASCSAREVNPRMLATSKSKDQVIHRHPVVLARRALIRYLLKEAKRRETGDVVSIFIVNDEGDLQLHPSCQLYLYSTYPYICENVVMGLEAMAPHDTNHCFMNKMRRWNVVGLQGALLSNIFAPVHISKVVYGTAPPIPNADIWRLLFGQLNIKDREMSFDSIEEPSTKFISDFSKEDFVPRPKIAPIVWFQGLTGLDKIGENGRLLEREVGSSVCKQEIFKAYLQLARAEKRILKYSRAKKMAGHYQLLKKILYKKWEIQRNGKWLKRKSNKADKFWVDLA